MTSLSKYNSRIIIFPSGNIQTLRTEVSFDKLDLNFQWRASNTFKGQKITQVVEVRRKTSDEKHEV